MCQIIHRTIAEETVKNISSAVFTNNKKLSKEDITYITEAENKLVLLFPINAALFDRHAFLTHFKHIVTRSFLMEFELENKKVRTRQKNTNDSQI